VVYSYADQEKDAEAATTIHWEIADDNTGTAKTTYSTSASPTFTSADAGKFVRVKITPRAVTGILNGVDYYGGWILIDAAIKPYATNVNISGKAEQGSTLTGAYTYNGGTNGVTTYTENTLGSTYQWQTASNNKGVGINNMAYPDGGTAFGKTIKPTINDVNKYIRFGVLAKDNEPTPNSSSNYVYSDWVGPITLAAEAAPIAKNVSYSPAPGVNITAKANYTYEDVNNDPEGASSYQWYSATNASGAGQTAISGATTLELLITNEYAGKYIGFGITPKALTGNLTGTEVVYYAPTASKRAADFTIVSATQNSNTFHINRTLSKLDSITVRINVTSTGSANFTTDIVNGYSFSGGGTYNTGSQDVTLVAKGTQLAYNGTGDNFTITGIGASTETRTIIINNVKLGNQLTSHFNGIVNGAHNTTNSSDDTYYLNKSYKTGETFHINSTCLTKPISTSACVGTTMTVGSNTYSITNINGQCWMTQNLKELPNGVAVNANQWLATSPGDLGFYGYYNTLNPSGNAGWSLSENTANEGLLYQWSAAMMGATDERAKGICPTGWHIPSDCEFMYLEHGLGMALNEQSKEGIRSDKIDSQGTPGHKLRSVGTGSTNISGFSAIGVGVRVPTSGAFDFKTNGYFWTSSQSTTTTAIGRGSVGGSSGVLRLGYTKNWTFNVRCLKD
jgi:uncharacterized protein (TIGR02145 family)